MKYVVAPGMKDLIKESPIYRKLETDFINLCLLNNFQEIRTPILESRDLFVRSVGEASDIVEKEMFTCDDLVLRPENTAPIVRAFLTQNLENGRYCYFAPQFRKERPQKGRFRQFYQYGFEMFGDNSPQLEIEGLLLIKSLYTQWKLSDFKIEVNYLGNFEERAKYLEALKDYFKSVYESLSETSKKRYESNTLRILDSKELCDQMLIANAPVINDYLTEESLNKWNKILNLCSLLEIKVEVNPRLVRGLDYYTGLVFEVIDTSGNLGSQKALGGGGRYDQLCADLGGKSIPAFGFAGGVERLILALNLNEEKFIDRQPLVCLITNKPEILPLLVNKKNLEPKLKIDICFSPEMGFKKMFKRADRLQARFVIILAEDELSKNQVKIKDMTSGNEATFKGALSDLDLSSLETLFTS